MNLDTCSVEELRDELAALARVPSPCCGVIAGKPGGCSHMKPRHYFPWTLDTISAMLPKPCWWEEITRIPVKVHGKDTCYYHAMTGTGPSFQGRGVDELEARARCVAKVLTALSATRGV